MAPNLPFGQGAGKNLSKIRQIWLIKGRAKKGRAKKRAGKKGQANKGQ